MGNAGLEERVLTTKHEVNPRMGIQEFKLGFPLLWFPHVVAIAETNERAGRSSDSCVAGGPESLVGPADDAHAREAPSHGRRIVGRTVVNHQNLNGGVVLGEKAFEAVAQEAGAVVNRNDHGDR